MSNNGPDRDELKTDLSRIAENGIQADRKRLKEDMCSQFADPREWIREYIVNAYDARAKRCWISGHEDKDTITIVVEDDGHGMDHQGVKDYNMIYRSIKHGDNGSAIGRHGIGKLSVAAIPGQSAFSMLTSTGKECWRMTAGCLMDETPINLERVEPVPAQGTRFEVTFKKSCSVRAELRELTAVLERYVCYLPIEIIVFEKTGDEADASEEPYVIQGSWTAQTERCSRTYKFKLNENNYEVIMGLKSGVHEIYQNRVFVSDSYNLLSFDMKNELDVPYLKIRVESPDFELPFGRHCLKNEEVLAPLSRYLRRYILPAYFAELSRHYEAGTLEGYNIFPSEVEEMACSLIEYDPDDFQNWNRMHIFRVVNGIRHSFTEIKGIACVKGVLYVEGEGDEGVDYSNFDMPVLARKQPDGCLELIMEKFKKNVVNLGLHDVVLEAPEGIAKELGPKEKRFEECLGFHPEVLEKRRQEKSKEQEGSGEIWQGSGNPDIDLSYEKIERMAGVCEESKLAMGDLLLLKWRVNYLVQRDGTTPSTSHKFLLKNNTIVLNLNHPEVISMLMLSEKAQGLASHWAMAMCLSDNNVILSHLTPEAREDLILLDGMAKCGMTFLPVKEDDQVEDGDDMKRKWNFMQDNDEFNISMN